MRTLQEVQSIGFVVWFHVEGEGKEAQLDSKVSDGQMVMPPAKNGSMNGGKPVC